MLRKNALLINVPSMYCCINSPTSFNIQLIYPHSHVSMFVYTYREHQDLEDRRYLSPVWLDSLSPAAVCPVWLQVCTLNKSGEGLHHEAPNSRAPL